jgi:AraC-like DNA-binding protein
MDTSSGFAVTRFSTAELPCQHRVAMWREHYGRVVLRVEIEPVETSAFDASLTTRAMPGLRLLLGKMSATRFARTRQLIADGNDDLALVINRRGALTTSARGSEVFVHEGDALLTSSGEITTFDRHSRGSFFSLRVPRAVLSSLVIDVDDAVMQRIPRHTEALKLLTSYTNLLLDEDAVSELALCRLTVAHIHDLIALTLGARRDAAEVARTRGMPAARLKVAKAYIVDNCDRQDLSIGTVAAQLGMTPRSLQRLFESEGATFSSFLLHQRLARARRMLIEPQFAERSIGAIAYDVGFGDLSYFNRCFRQRYGATPRDIREASAN